ncbi:MAG TPA: Ig-like domain-containing protein [Mycobacteriales bacterium]|nr:Ig-like domain-containing protein [Mycobacteriales bacterium]
MHRLGKHRASKRRTAHVVGAVVMLLSAYALAGPTAQAVDKTGVFELDGNATHQTADDWDNVCHQVTITDDTQNQFDDQCASANDTNGATATSWTSEPNLNSTIFTGGGSKDPQNISSWAWKDGAGGLPDKDNLLHSFAARYSITPNTDCSATKPDGSVAATCDVLFFGSDRYDNSGDAQQGFWFFQNPIGLAHNSVNGGSGFTGVHKDGDVLVISDFSNGGSTSTITVYQWNHLCKKTGTLLSNGDSCGDQNLETLETSANANCTSVSGDAFCGIVNTTDGVASPWSYGDKSGNNSYLAGEFYEGGINLTSLGLADECFSSVASETRSSTSTTATLKDFVLGSFANCSATMFTNVAAGPVTPGTTVNDTATVTGSSSAHTPSGNVTFYLCGPLATGACTSGGTNLGTGALSGTGAVATASSPDVNTASDPLSPGRYCFRAEWSGDTNYTQPLVEYGGPTGTGGTVSGHNECFTTAKINTQTVTTPVDASGASVSSVTLGSTVYDRAIVTGTAAGGDPTGSVNFYVCGPIATGTCDGTTNTGTAVSGNPKALVADSDAMTYTASTTSGGVTPASVGRYCFRGEYGGSTVYNSSADSAATECFTVTDSTGLTSAQTWLPNDSATVTSAHGSPLSGTLSIALYDSPDCTGTAVTGQTYSWTVSGSSPITKTTTNSTYTVSTSKSVSWKVVFTSSDSNIPGSDHCESSAVTVTN